MAINPPSDIVLGVALAADPAKYRAAADRLQQMRATAAAAEFATEVLPARPPVDAPSPRPAIPAQATSTTTATPRRARSTPDAFGQLEAFVMQTFIQSMLPKNAASVFGKGIAGEYWKSMLAERLGSEIAGSGQLGLAKRLAGNRTASIATPVDAGIAARAAVLAGPRQSLAEVVPYLQSEPAAPGDDAAALRELIQAERSRG